MKLSNFGREEIVPIHNWPKEILILMLTVVSQINSKLSEANVNECCFSVLKFLNINEYLSRITCYFSENNCKTIC